MLITIEDIFQSYPRRLRTQKAKSYRGIFHFDLTDTSSQAQKYTISIEGGQCQVSKGLLGKASCTVQASTQTYLEIELGNKDAQRALASGELKIDNALEMLNFTKLFDPYPAPDRQAEKALKGTASRKPQSGPLQGLKVLDFTRLLPGPLATMMLADMGAEVIKIESPSFYDYTRDMPPHQGGESVGYLAFNRSKRSLCIDYASEKGRQIVLDMIQEIDILIEQFRPGVMAKMGLSYEDLKKVNPRLIYVSITGYGHTGPYAHLAGHDLNYITLAGILSGNQNEAPQAPLVQMADIAGGSYMSMVACLSAVYAREQTGEGQFIDVAMMDGVMPLAVNAMAVHWAMEKNVPRDEAMLSGGLINYGIYPTQDGRYVALGTLEPKFWHRFCDAVEKPEWKNRMMAPNPKAFAQYKQELSALFQTQTAAYWHQFGLENDLLLNIINEQSEVEKDPQVQAREMIVKQQHPTAGEVKSVAMPLKFSATKAQAHWPPPLLGEDSVAILQEAGISEETMQELIEKGILKCSAPD